MLKVSLVEDDTDFKKMLTATLRSDEDIELVGVYNSAEEFLSGIQNTPCDVVVMDIHLPGDSGIECVRKSKALYPDLQFTMCTIFDDGQQLFDSLKAGAVGYILKYRAAEEIVAAVKDIYAGGSPISAPIARKMVGAFQEAKKVAHDIEVPLTKREQEVLGLLAEGYRYKEIAAALFISEETVRTHVRNLYEKLQVQSRTEAINKAFGQPGV